MAPASFLLLTHSPNTKQLQSLSVFSSMISYVFVISQFQCTLLLPHLSVLSSTELLEWLSLSSLNILHPFPLSPFSDPIPSIYQGLLDNLALPCWQTVKNLPAVQETLVWSLGWEDTLEKRIATHSSIFAWRIPWTEKPGRLNVICKGPDNSYFRLCWSHNDIWPFGNILFFFFSPTL